MTLTLGSLPPWLVAALGPLPAQSGGLRWSFLLASPLLTTALVLAGAYGMARESTWRGATAGDVNGDALDDIIIGANAYDNGGFDEGAANVFHGSTTAMSAIQPADCDVP